MWDSRLFTSTWTFSSCLPAGFTLCLNRLWERERDGYGCGSVETRSGGGGEACERECVLQDRTGVRHPVGGHVWSQRGSDLCHMRLYRYPQLHLSLFQLIWHRINSNFAYVAGEILSSCLDRRFAQYVYDWISELRVFLFLFLSWVFFLKYFFNGNKRNDNICNFGLSIDM
jgi:hypothetical protein